MASWLERQPNRPSLLIPLLVYLFLFYSGATMCPYSFDDISLIVTNPFLRDWRHLFTVLSAGRPVRGVSFMLDYALWGLDPTGFHLTNIMLHFAGVVLFYFLILQIFGRPRLALLAAALFGFHPIQSEAVIGIAHRKELLAMTFLCLSYLSYLRWGQRGWGLVLSLLAYVLALLSKQVALALPALLLAHELILPRKELSRARRYLPLLPYLALPALAFLFQFQDFRWFGRFQPVDFAEAKYSRILATSLQTFPVYLRLAFFPMHLTVDYDLPLVSSPWSLGPALGLLALVSLTGLIALLARRKPILAFGLAWYLISLVPVLNLIPANAFLAERYLYIPSAGICLVLAGLLRELVVRPEPIWSGRAEAWVQAFLLFLLAACFFGFNPNPFYLRVIAPAQSLQGRLDPARALIVSALLSAALLTAAVAGFEAWRRRGGILARSLALRFAVMWVIFALLFVADVSLARFLATGRVALSEIHVTQAYSGLFHWLQQEARPGPRGRVYYIPTGSLATELFNLSVFWVGYDSFLVLGFFGLARRFRRQAPNGGLAFMLVAVLIVLMENQITYRIRDWGAEVSLWQATVRENPRSVIGWNNLGRAYSLRGKWPPALEAVARAFTLDPTNSDIALNLGILELRLGHLPQARSDFEQAVELSPLNVTARLNLANCLAAQADSKNAIQQYLEVLGLDPNSAHAHYNLAALYHNLQQDQPALYHLRQALAIDPQYQKALELMREIQAAAIRPPASQP